MKQTNKCVICGKKEYSKHRDDTILLNERYGRYYCQFCEDGIKDIVLETMRELVKNESY